MDELVSFSLIPTIAERYIADNLKINKYLFGFSKSKEVNGVRYMIDVHKNSVNVSEDRGFGYGYEYFCKIEQDGEVLEYSVNKIENILKSFKEGMQEHIKKKMEWEQKSKIHISI